MSTNTRPMLACWALRRCSSMVAAGSDGGSAAGAWEDCRRELLALLLALDTLADELRQRPERPPSLRMVAGARIGGRGALYALPASDRGRRALSICS